MRGTVRLFGAVATLALAALGLPQAASAQYDAPPPPAAYALQNVTVVQADGTRTPGVTLVVRGELIEAMGTGAGIPADAKVLEGDSLLVYPGMVDLTSTAEHEFPEPRDVEDEDDVTSWSPPRSASGFMPHRLVARHLTAVGEDLAPHREKGIVAGMVHPDGGMAPGQPAVIVHRADAGTPWELVTGESAGLTMALETAGGVYPSQLFGVIAYLRQAFLDAERYATARAAYGRDASGMSAPSWDPDYEALLAAARGEAPVFFEANRDEDIRRVLNLADEFGFSPVIVGGQEAWKMTGELARRGVPVLVSTDFPDPDDWDPEADTAGVELDPDAVREKEEIEAAWANAGLLEAAGVRFAFVTDGGSGDLLEGARKAVEHGLSEAGALRALTAIPAGMAGLPALGRIGVDGTATFMVADGDLLADGESGVVYTFVEGRLEEGRALGGGGEGGEPASDVSGEWEGEVSAQGMEIGFTLTVTMTPDGSLEGTMAVEGQGDADVTGSVSGSDVTLVIEAPGMPDAIRLTGSLSEDGTSMRGGGSTPMGELSFSATKNPGARGSNALGWAELFGAGQGTSDTGGAR